MPVFNLAKRALPAAVALLVSACATPPTPTADSLIPDQWQSPTAGAEALPLTWWTLFEQPALSHYLEQVRARNLDLANAERTLSIAQLTLKDAGLDLLPQPSVSLGVNQGFSDTLDDGLARQTTRSADATATLSYNDLLKKPGQYRLARATYDAAEAQQVSLALETYNTAALAYFQRLLVLDRIAAARQNLANSETLMTIVQSRVDNGTTTPIDALQQRIAVQQQRNTLATLLQNEYAARATLALLIGQPVSAVNFADASLQGVRVPEVAPGLPADLLLRRPDLLQAQANLRAASADLHLARMAFLPNISLTGQAGAASESLADLVSSPTQFIGASASLLVTLLDNGARARTNTRARLRLENALGSYRKAALSAFNEVNVLLSNQVLLRELAEVAGEDLARAEEAYRIAEVRYQQGAANYQTLLTTQNTLFATRVNFLQTKQDRLAGLLDLVRALGGGWQAGASAPSALFN